jgi:rhodanese-related sulfurtransferase
MKPLLLALFILSAAVASAASAASAAEKDFAAITQKELTDAIAAKSALVIDVNGSDSYKDGHIPTAIDFEAKEKQLAAVLPADKSALIVAYCGSPQCPAWKQAADAVSALGYTNVKHFVGGISVWKDSGAPVEK